jgi:restriction system protein
MAIPDFQSIMLPLMQFCRDGREHTTSETADALATTFKLTTDERKALFPSGVQEIFVNRLAWAKSHLKMAGLLESPKRGVFKITERGIDVLGKKPAAINLKYLFQFPEYVQFRNTKRIKTETDDSDNDHPATPEEALELLQRLKSSSPAFFERLLFYGGIETACAQSKKPFDKQTL